MEKAIELKNVSKGFKNKDLYSDVNLTIQKGECVGFVGKNGSGKSVLFKIMSGLVPPDTGSVLIREKRLGDDGVDFPENVGILINEPGYIDYYSGIKNLMLLAEIRGKIGKDKIRQTMLKVGLNPDDTAPVRKYSMGMKQKLGIAQAIMEGQDIIILDEPYNALDFDSNKEISAILKMLKEDRKTLILTSHQHEYLDRLCDTLYCIHNKHIVPFTEELREEYFKL